MTNRNGMAGARTEMCVCGKTKIYRYMYIYTRIYCRNCLGDIPCVGRADEAFIYLLKYTAAFPRGWILQALFT